MSEVFFNKYIPLNLFARFERVVWGSTVRGSWRPNITAMYWPPTLMAVNVVSFSFSRAAQAEVQGHSSLLGDGFLYCILSPTSLDPNSSGGPEGPYGLVWLSLPHLISNSNCNSNCLTSVLTELYNSSRPLNRPPIFGMACLIVIKWK